MMASRSARTSPDKQRRIDGSLRRPSPVFASKSGNSESINPLALPKASSQVTSELNGTKGMPTVSTDLPGSVKSLATEVASKLAIGDLKDPSTYIMNSSGVGCKVSSENNLVQEKKISEQGPSPGSAKVSDGNSSFAKTSGSAKISDRLDCAESGKSSMCRGSTCSDVSDESSCSSFSSSVNKPHKANDHKWEAIQAVRAKDGVLGLSHFRLLKKLGCGDIGSVYLSELSGTKCYFAMKVMDKGSLASRKKLLRAQTEREILQSLDHPFLPSLYTHFETEKFSCLVMEFCPGGDLHTLRQRQPGKHFSEQAVKYDTFLDLT